MPKHTLVATLAAVLLNAACGPASAQDAGVNVQIVDAMNKAFGVHPGYRANHAKGIVAEGSFVASKDAATLTRSPIFAGAKLPVVVRFSDATGIPTLPDASPGANPHGLAIKFHLPGGSDSDIVVNSLKFFPVATPEEFRDLLLAVASTPPGGPPSAQLDAFLKAHPTVATATAAMGTPDSFADEQYNGVDAFVFTNKDGKKQAFRYVVTPEKIVHLGAEDAAKKSPTYLIDDLPQRLAKGPITFHIKAQLAAAEDSTKDPTIAWPENRKVVDLGTLTISKVVADSMAAEKKLLFIPGRLTDGIEPSDDPLITARNGAYAVSFGRRSATP